MILVQIFVAFMAAVAMFYSVGCLNRMTSATHHAIRAAYVMISAGAFGEIAAIVYGDVPSWPSAITTAGVAFLLVCEKRLRILCLPRRRTLHD